MQRECAIVCRLPTFPVVLHLYLAPTPNHSDPECINMMTTTQKPEPARNGRVKVLIVDDHPIVCERLDEVINCQPDMVVCGTASDRARGMTLVEQTRPDVAIVDLSLGRESGFELIKDIVVFNSRVAVLVLTMHEEAVFGERSARAGARGYLVKNVSSRVVVEAVRCLRDGGTCFSPALTARLASRVIGQPRAACLATIDTLPDREAEIVRWLAQGLTTPQISERLGIAESTVETHYARIREKLNIENLRALRQAAIRWSQRPDSPPA